MGEIRSAWEIAQEKAEKLGGLSAEEIKRQKKEKAGSIAGFLAEKYLLNPNRQELDAINNYGNEEKELIRGALLVRLVDAIELGKGARLNDINKAISALAEGEEVSRGLKAIEELFQEYNETEHKVREQIDQVGKEILHQLRISGTAVGDINPQAKEEWRRRLENFAQPFREKLQTLKQELFIQLNVTAP